MSDQEGYDRKEALAIFTEDIGNRIFQGSMKTESLFSSACIYRVPQDLRELNKSAYTPRLIAIGPFHRGEPHLQTMQHVKMYYDNYLFFRVAEGIEDEGKRDKKKFELLQQCVEKMKELVDVAKKCYAEEVKVKHDDEMAEMMLVDGCFILELLYASYHDKKTKEAGKSTTKGGDSGNSKASSSSVPEPINEGEQYDPIIDNILTAKNIKQDLLLLQNQIPFFVLEELFKLTVDKIPGGTKLSLKEYVVSYFDDIQPADDENSGSATKTNCCSPSHCVVWICGSAKENEQEKILEPTKANHEDYYHILHLLHDYYGPGDQGEKRKLSGVEQNSALRCCHTRREKYSELNAHASELDYGGVKFVPVEEKNLFEVKFRERKGLRWWFHRATFKIPTLIIHDHTEPFLRNLIAFEQLCPRVSPYFTSYAKLMDVLINSETDVQLLREAKVIGNYLGEDKAVSDLFNKLCKEVVPGNFIEKGNFYFNDTCQKAYQYSKHWWPRYMAYWRRTYFASPWAFKTFCLALGLFVIQIMEILNTSTKIAVDLGYLNNRNTTSTN